MSDLLQKHLAVALAATAAAPLCVAFSGGPDSSALLHALAQLPVARERGLRALHVDHGLHADSDLWAEHCRHFCAALELRCEVLPVHVDTGRGDGLEAAARRARYAALARDLHAGESLLLGHHRDDQAETVLLKLLRGAGPQGLGGMRVFRPLGDGQLWRPLLDCSRAQLHAYVDAHQLDCIDDASNRDIRLARNHLRHEILPRLLPQWPQAVDSILHSARLCAAAAAALRTQWLEALDDLQDAASGSIRAEGWLTLDAALREPLLDHWLHTRGFTAPTTAQRRQLERQCLARAGQMPCVRWPGVELHIWRGRLWALPAAPAVRGDWTASWRGEPLTLPDGGTLCLSDPAARLENSLEVRLRRGGERIKPNGDAHTRELRDLFQRGAVPPWQRAVCPLLYAEGELIGVADRWLTARGMEIFAPTAARPIWQPAR